MRLKHCKKISSWKGMLGEWSRYWICSHFIQNYAENEPQLPWNQQIIQVEHIYFRCASLVSSWIALQKNTTRIKQYWRWKAGNINISVQSAKNDPFKAVTGHIATVRKQGGENGGKVGIKKYHRYWWWYSIQRWYWWSCKTPWYYTLKWTFLNICSPRWSSWRINSTVKLARTFGPLSSYLSLLRRSQKWLLKTKLTPWVMAIVKKRILQLKK